MKKGVRILRERAKLSTSYPSIGLTRRPCYDNVDGFASWSETKLSNEFSWCDFLDIASFFVYRMRLNRSTVIAIRGFAGCLFNEILSVRSGSDRVFFYSTYYVKVDRLKTEREATTP